MDRPVFLPRDALEALRGERGFGGAAKGLWCAGDPAGLSRPCVAIVGTRAATRYGKRVAWEFAAELGKGRSTIQRIIKGRVPLSQPIGA